MKWFLYNFLFGIAYFAMLPKFVSRMKKRGGYGAHFNERFGRFDPATAARLAEKPRVWVHAVSVGEANIAGNLLGELRKRAPGISFIISTTSSTGRGICEKFAQPDDVLIYLPIDFPRFVKRAMRTINARALVLTESEFWPNLIRLCHTKKIPVVLVNGRISDRSAPRYKKGKFFFRDVFRCFSLMMTQSETDRERLVAAGADAATTRVMGSVKFDVPDVSHAARDVAQHTLADAGIGDAATILLGASTWPGEEAALIDAWKTARQTHPALRLVLVPRHMERGDEVEKIITDAGCECIRRSRTKNSEKSVRVAESENSVLLVDTTGELFALCERAHIVFVGKSLAPNIGAQNMIEPAAFGKAVIVGNHTENFTAVMAIFRTADAMLEVDSPAALTAAVVALSGDAVARDALGAKAKATVDAQRGALARSAEALLEMVQRVE